MAFGCPLIQSKKEITYFKNVSCFLPRGNTETNYSCSQKCKVSCFQAVLENIQLAPKYNLTSKKKSSQLFEIQNYRPHISPVEYLKKHYSEILSYG